MKQKKAVMVLGMHRSGTSVLTGILNRLGYSIGSSVMPKNKYNPKGYYENSKICEVNDMILNDHKTSYNRFNIPKIKNEKKYFEEIKTLIQQQFNNKKILIKDPRMAFVFPYWEYSLKNLNYKLNLIIQYREYTSIANSLYRREGFSLNKSLLLTLLHYLYILKYTKEYKSLVVSYELIIKKSKNVLDEITRYLDVENFDEEKIEKFINPKLSLSNKESFFDRTKADQYLISMLDKVYSHLEKKCLKVSNLETFNFQSEIHKYIGWDGEAYDRKVKENLRNFNRYKNLEKEKEEVKNLLNTRKREICDMKNSFSWKVTKPLRLIGKVLNFRD